MDHAMISQVRTFNRRVTERVGALDDHFLSRDLPLGEARLLWEIGDDACDVRSLRTRLDLDSGYVSRLLRSLEAAGLVTVEALESDRRVRVARLTRAGRTERAVLDQRSDELAASLLEPLDERQRLRLVDAMAEVERLLTAAAVQLAPLDPTHPHAEHCLREYLAELDQRFRSGFDPARSHLARAEQLRPPSGVLLVATLASEPVGCGGLRLDADGVAEIKRMWVVKTARGLGLGRRLLTGLETYAASHDVRVLRLETNGTLSEAVSLYRSSGYVEVAPFNDEAYAEHWFEKRL